jgi:hypothetical protein
LYPAVTDRAQVRRGAADRAEVQRGVT